MQANRVQQQPYASLVSSASAQGAASATPAVGPQLQSRPAEAPQAFFDAARNGDVGALATMLALRQASAAALEPKTGAVRLLLEAGADCKRKDQLGETAYSIALKKSFHEIALLLQGQM